MITAIICLAFAALLVFREREIRKERERWETERQSLLDRIQHPEVRQVAVAQEYEPPEVPRDAAELAMVGEIVPEFIHVGSEE